MNRQRKVNRPDKKQCALAYALLVLVLWLTWQLVVAPLYSYWDDHRSATLKLSKTLAELQLIRSSQEIGAAQTIDSVKALSKKGDFSSTLLNSEAGHELYQALKSAIDSTSAKLVQSRPGVNNNSKWFLRSELEANFQIDPHRLDEFLHSVSQARPRVNVELLSLRRPSYVLSNARSGQVGSSDQATTIEATIKLSMWFATKQLYEIVGALPKVRITQLDSANIPAMPMVLGGLFDAAYRDRLRNPGPQHYRLSAITARNDTKVAVLIDKHSGKTARISGGDKVEGWEVTDITDDSVELSLGERQINLKL